MLITTGIHWPWWFLPSASHLRGVAPLPQHGRLPALTRNSPDSAGLGTGSIFLIASFHQLLSIYLYLPGCLCLKSLTKSELFCSQTTSYREWASSISSPCARRTPGKFLNSWYPRRTIVSLLRRNGPASDGWQRYLHPSMYGCRGRGTPRKSSQVSHVARTIRQCQCMSMLWQPWVWTMLFPQREQCMQPSTILWGPFSDTSPISPFDGFFLRKQWIGDSIEVLWEKQRKSKDGKKCLFDASQERVSSCFEVTPSPIPLGRAICCILPHLHAGINNIISSCDRSWWLQ